ncbi:uncharacterized protein LOC124916431 [Impatiens glandulifera]|uniref:uncharacterized protein LOC124916431 n=1 Tax=Impatiens glandulifera TaxID=253017 RepID=UPI001FB087C0|nr:uncharacterized protein LOC124916431 [Impatiens glandulifera]
MDADISRWIVEFLVTTNISDITLKKVIDLVLPVNVVDPSLKKAMLIRAIVSEISKSAGVASHKMLELMEELVDLEPPSHALQTAYCDVAVDVTVNMLKQSEEKYIESVNVLWKTKIESMINNSNGLVCEDLLEWKHVMEASLLDGTCSHLCEDDPLKILRDSNYESLKSLRDYINEVRSNMGPSFLQRVAQMEGIQQLLQGIEISADERNRNDGCDKKKTIEVINLEDNDEEDETNKKIINDTTKKGESSLPTLKRKGGSSSIRRRRKFWSNLEEDTLRDGVKKFGHGNWKSILEHYKDIFEERTEVDLKDKWRNMMR